MPARRGRPGADALTLRGPAATFLTGALFVLSYALGTPGYDVPGLPLVCLAPFLALASSARSVRHAAWQGWIAGTAASIPLYYWIAYTVGVQGKLGWALGGVAAFLVSAYVGAYFSIAAAVARRLEGRFGERGLWLFPAAWRSVAFPATEYPRSIQGNPEKRWLRANSTAVQTAGNSHRPRSPNRPSRRRAAAAATEK